MTEYLRPHSLEEALAARRAHADYVVLAGGTDLLVAANSRAEPPGFIDLFGLAPMVGIAMGADGGITIGAATTYREILSSGIVKTRLPALAAAAREVGALQIQARGTLGGNMVTSSPVGDTLPVLLALDAEVELASEAGSRVMPYRDFITGYRQTALGKDELIVRIRFPELPAGTRQFWRKMGTRRAQSISKVMVAASGRVEDGVITHLRLALGAVADRPVRAIAAETAVMGKAPGAELSEVARQAVQQEITPIDDVRSTASYRLQVACNVVGRFIQGLAEPQP